MVRRLKHEKVTVSNPSAPAPTATISVLTGGFLE